MAMLCALAFLATGSYIYVQTNVKGNYAGAAARTECTGALA